MEIFKSYDIRGIYPSELDGAMAARIGTAIALFLAEKKEPKNIVIGRDMRASGEEISSALISALTTAGCKVWDLGLVSTDVVYFASGKYNLPGIMITASHNTAEYNGFKIVLSGARGVGQGSGMDRIEELCEKTQAAEIGQAAIPETRNDILSEYISYLKSQVNIDSTRTVKVVIDAGNGMAGKIIPLLTKDLPIEVEPLYFELDGSFPNHEANPLKPETLFDLQAKIRAGDYDLGIAFDGDADRAIFLDEKGNLIDSSQIICLVAKTLLEKNPGSKILYNAVCSRAVPEIITELGGEPVRERVGHSFIKKTMREQDIIFGGEKSGHFFYRDLYFADSGFMTALLVWQIYSQQEKKMSELVRRYSRYYAIPETNFAVADKEAVIGRLAGEYSDGQIDRLDGLTASYPDWWFNVRPSGSEPLLRLNLEANSEELLNEKAAEIRGKII
ncbi:MAG: phosphomannomutase/phosphoglucomutase [Candidatus Komeilibacteria bacterium]|nr:phosphomannomutase/phosphoglucomutase [Candidatus Komeilibacteria bacterium]